MENVDFWNFCNKRLGEGGVLLFSFSKRGLIQSLQALLVANVDKKFSESTERCNFFLFFFCFWTSCLEIHPYLHNGCHEILKYPDSAVREVSMFKSFKSFIYVCLSIFTTYSVR